MATAAAGGAGIWLIDLPVGFYVMMAVVSPVMVARAGRGRQPTRSVYLACLALWLTALALATIRERTATAVGIYIGAVATAGVAWSAVVAFVPPPAPTAAAVDPGAGPPGAGRPPGDAPQVLWSRTENDWWLALVDLVLFLGVSRERRYSVAASTSGLTITDTSLRDSAAPRRRANRYRSRHGLTRFIAWETVADITPLYDEWAGTLLRVALDDGSTVDLSIGHLPAAGTCLRPEVASERFRALWEAWRTHGTPG
jgi:hypothetical protein